MIPSRSMRRSRLSTAAFVSGVVALCAIGGRSVSAQFVPIPGQSVNMVSGTEWPEGDPFLQRQNEGSMAVSTRNPLHILGGGNDYRTVDIPGLPGMDVIADAWLGVFWSRDGGHKWKSTLLPGYPQDTSPAGLNSPLRGFQAGADPVVRAGANGMMFYAGITFNRESQTGDNTIGKKGVLFLSRFIDDNAKETGNPFRYQGTGIADNGNAGRFLDKPWLAVDIPRMGAGTCSIPGTATIPPQTFPAGNVYLTYTMFVGNDKNIRSIVWFVRSTDCGATWGPASKLSEGYPINQGSVIAIHPMTGAVYVAWRRFKSQTQTDGIVFAMSTDGGKSFTKPIEIAAFTPYLLPNGTEVSRIFEQGTTIASFRTTGFPALAVDHNGVAYAAWSQRGIGPGQDARIMISRSADGVMWAPPEQLDETEERGHQFMPSLVFHGGKVAALYYTQREDHTIGKLEKDPDPNNAFFNEKREAAGNLAKGESQSVFWDFLADFAPEGTPKLVRRHTIHVWTGLAAPAPPGTPLNFVTSRVSRYAFGSLPFPVNEDIRQFQFHPPNLPLFACKDELANCRAFVGDYLDMAGAASFVPRPDGTWEYNLNENLAHVFHAVWTDNRDVRPPADGNWHRYTPPNSPFSKNLPGASLFDPNQTRPVCDPGENAGGFSRAGMRNQNLYTARITEGLVAGSPQNSKPLGFTTIDGETFVLQRAFVVFAHNYTDETRTFRLTIANQPADFPSLGKASFSQFPLLGHPDPLTELFVRIPARSSATRSVFVTSGIKNASVKVLVEEFSGLPADGGGLIDPAVGGLQATVVLNPDLTNPDLTNPDLTNPDLTNPDITNAEVYNPDLTNPDLTNPDLTNPDLTNPDLTNPDLTNPDLTNPDLTNVQLHNPDITNPDLTNPDLTNPDLTNPDLTNPDLTNPDLTNSTVTDATWTATSNGNTTGGYRVKLLVNGKVPDDFDTQLIIHRGYSTPVADGCNLAMQRQSIIVANIPSPQFLSPLSPDLTNPDVTNPDITNATFFVGPGDDWTQITLRMIDRDPANGQSPEDFINDTVVTPVVVGQAVNTLELIEGSTTPPVANPSTSIVFVVPPGGGTVGEPISPAVQVQVRDDNGAVIPGAMVTLSIPMGTGPEGATISGNTAMTDIVGIATFPALTLTPAGVYTLTATVSGMGAPSPATSAPFMILEACAADGQATVLHSVVNDEGESNPVASLAANFDGDQYPDMVVIHEDGTITKMQGDGLGIFLPQVQFTIPNPDNGALSGPTSVAVGDFNGDGLDDVVVAYPAHGRLGIVLSDAENADDYFTAAPTSIVLDGTPQGLVVGRFNGDGHDDLAVALSETDQVAVLLGDGEGGFGAPVLSAAGLQPWALAVGDFNGEGGIDLAVANRAQPSVSVLLGDNLGGFTESAEVFVGVRPVSIAARDLNGDGFTDVAVANTGDSIEEIQGSVQILTGNGAGLLSGPTTITLAGMPQSVAVGDFDSDDRPDLAVANGTHFLLLFNSGGGMFGAPVSFVAGNEPVHVSAADINGDGRTDLFITNNEPNDDEAMNETISVLISNCGAATADLMAQIEDSPDPVLAGETVTYTTDVTNGGPFDATNVTLTFGVSNGSIESAFSPAGECTEGNPFVCSLGTLAPGASTIVTVVVRAPLGVGPVTIFADATVRADQVDLDPTSNGPEESTAVTPAPATFVVTNTNDSGPGSFRQALLNANQNAPANDTILFDIPGDAPHTIMPQSPLPGIGDTVLIDAPTTGECAGAPPTVEIDGSAAGLSHGLVVNTSGVVIRGLSITNFQFAGIFLAGGGFNVVECSYLGLAPDGVTAKGNDEGVRISGSSNNTVGGAAAGVRNVISGNFVRSLGGGSGVTILGPSGSNEVVGNFIGTDATGTLDRGNALQGVQVVDAPNNIIENNVVSGNNGEGVGIYGANATGNFLQWNRIGTNAAGTAALGNNASGVYIRRAPANEVGLNQVSGNIGFAGIAICGNAGFCGGPNLGTQTSNASGNIVRANLIGTDVTGSAALGNAQRGVSIDGAPNTIVGGTTAAERNVISANGLLGIVIFAPGATGNQILGNYIGTKANGTEPLPNATDGVSIDGASNNSVGGALPGAGNVISGNKRWGIQVSGAGSTGNVIQGNLIGVAATGTAALGNGGVGILLQSSSSGTLIGGTMAGARNVISANGGSGVEIVTTSNANQVQGNLIGTNAAGTAAVANFFNGVTIGSAKNVIGGTTAEARNIISGNNDIGVVIGGAAPAGATGNQILGNYIGTTITGAAPLPNGDGGVTIFSAPGNSIGGSVEGAGNVISANGGHGVEITGAGATANVVRGNFIGTDANGLAGSSSLGNASSGVAVTVSAAGTTIGGTTAAGAQNVIAFNGGPGIRVTGGTQNLLRFNRIDANGGLGIDLGGSGVTANDLGDGDAGPNDLQNFPVLTAVSLDGSTLNIQGSLNSILDTAFTIDFFVSEACDPSGNGEGAVWFGSSALTTDGTGNLSLNLNFSGAPVSTGKFITALATNPANSTSEFSACIAVTEPPAAAGPVTVFSTYGGSSHTVYAVLPLANGYLLAGDTISDAGDKDLWAMRVDALGAPVWQKRFGGTGSDGSAQDPFFNGRLTLVGATATSDGGFALAGTTTSFGNGGQDAYVVKLDGSGNVMWQRAYGTAKSEGASAIIESPTNQLLVAGSAAQNPTGSGAGNYDAWVFRVNMSDGSVASQWRFGRSSIDEYASSIIATPDTGFAFTGWLGEGEVWVLKANGNGEIDWQRSFGTVAYDIGNSIIGTSDGGFGIAAGMNGSGALLKLTSTGAVEWARSYNAGGTSGDAFDVVQHGDATFTLAGRTNVLAGNDAFWILRLASDGGLVWQRTYGTAGARAFAVAGTSDGGFVAAGQATIGSSLDAMLLKAASDGTVASCGTLIASYVGSMTSFAPSVATPAVVMSGGAGTEVAGGSDLGATAVDANQRCGLVAGTINFETPSLGAANGHTVSPYIATSAVTFTAQPGEFGDEVVRLVRNAGLGTSACVPPESANQMLGTSRAGLSGSAAFRIRATFVGGIAAGTEIVADFQTLAGQTAQVQLYASDGTLVGSGTAIVPSTGVCPDNSGTNRGRVTVSAIAAQAAAYAILDLEGTTGVVFVIDDFKIQ